MQTNNMHYTEKCKCESKYCKHYKSDYDEYIEEQNMFNNKPNYEDVLKAIRNYIQKVGQDRIDKNEYFTNYNKRKHEK